MVKIKVVLSATNRAWGYLFKEEEGERFKKKLEEIKDELPEDLELEIHSFTNSSEEINFISSLNGKGPVILPAACEGDVLSLFTMYVYKSLTGLPSFISAPVIDISKNTCLLYTSPSPRD